MYTVVISRSANWRGFIFLADQEEHGAILEMATAVRMVVRQTALARKQGEDKTIDDIDIDDVIVSLIADLQQIQDKEAKAMMTEIPNKVLKCFLLPRCIFVLTLNAK